MKHYLPVFALTIILVFLPHSASAQGYKVTPRIIDKEVKQRDIFTETISITNERSHQVHLYPSVNAVAVDEGGDISAFTPPSMSDNTQTVTSWLSISRGRLTVGPGKTVEIPVYVKIHPRAEAGVYHVFIGFGTGRNSPEAQKQVASGQAPGVIVTLSVDQKKTEFLKLNKFIVDRFVTSPENSAITYTLSNPGSAAVVPSGEIIISNGRGEEVAAVLVNPNSETLAPGQETTYVIPAPTEDLMGKYKAFLSVDYGSTQLASVYDTAFFYVLPWQKIVILFVVVLVIAVVLTLSWHRRNNAYEYEDDHDELPLHIKEDTSEDQDHDINLKQ
ncbi:MAG: hypothetical protein ACI9VM_000134 [Candidatus Azotimanducaceae bacterium]|jgi:hypothetical protein